MARSLFDKTIDETPKDQENNFAKKVNGRRKARSGAYRSNHGAKGSGNRGDVTSKDFEFELKQTEKKQISIKLEWLERMARGARPIGKKPAVHIEFKHIDRLCDNKWILIEESTFLEMINETETKE